MTKVLTIVGAGPGLGTALAAKFGTNGYSVGLLARDQGVLDAMRADLEPQGITIATATGDVTDADALRAAIDALAAELGTADVVMSNTSMFVEGLPTQVPLGVFEATWRVACLSTVITLQHVAPGMIEKGSGTFLVPGTALALRPWPGGSALGSAKAAARNYVMGAAAELKPHGVHATTITIDGAIKEGTAFDPVNIADAFWSVSQQPESEWTPELVFKPE